MLITDFAFNFVFITILDLWAGAWRFKRELSAFARLVYLNLAHPPTPEQSYIALVLGHVRRSMVNVRPNSVSRRLKVIMPNSNQTGPATSPIIDQLIMTSFPCVSENFSLKLFRIKAFSIA